VEETNQTLFQTISIYSDDMTLWLNDYLSFPGKTAFLGWFLLQKKAESFTLSAFSLEDQIYDKPR